MAEQITVSVDSDVADVYRSASDEERRKLDLLINFRLRDATKSEKSLREVMSDISRNAQRRGLTPENPQSIPEARRGETRSPFSVPGVNTRATTADVLDAVSTSRKKP